MHTHAAHLRLALGGSRFNCFVSTGPSGWEGCRFLRDTFAGAAFQNPPQTEAASPLLSAEPEFDNLLTSESLSIKIPTWTGDNVK